MVYLQRRHGWCHMKLLLYQHVLCTPYNHAPCHFLQSHTHKVPACLAVTCHLHFWQNDRDLSRVTVVAQGWNGYRNKNQQKKMTRRRKLSCHFCRDSNLWHFNHEFTRRVAKSHLKIRGRRRNSQQVFGTHLWGHAAVPTAVPSLRWWWQCWPPCAVTPKPCRPSPPASAENRK